MIIGPADHADRGGTRRCDPDGLERTQSGEDAGRIWRQLQPGPKLLEAVGSLIDCDVEPCPRQRNCGREATDPRSGSDGAQDRVLRGVAKLAFGRRANSAELIVEHVTS